MVHLPTIFPSPKIPFGRSIYYFTYAITFSFSISLLRICYLLYCIVFGTVVFCYAYLSSFKALNGLAVRTMFWFVFPFPVRFSTMHLFVLLLAFGILFGVALAIFT